MYKHISFYCFLIFLVSILVYSPKANAQNLGTQNLSNIKVDQLSDEQVRSFVRQASASGMSESQMMEMAAQRGMSQDEIQKLQKRVEQLQQGGGSNNSGQQQGQGNNGSQNSLSTGRRNNSRRSNGWWGQDSTRFQTDSLLMRSQKQLDTEADKALAELKAKIFGANLFKGSNPQFEPNLRVATPQNYVIGADDEVILDIYGYSEASYTLSVTPEGTINVPYVGVISVGGATVEQATSRIKDKLSAIYTGIRSGNTKVSLSIGNLRSIKVIVTGEVEKPGTYTLPSVATVFNALYVSGGPTEKGTFRNIRVFRDGKQISTVDVYDFLMNGSLRENVTLRDQDVIQVSPYVSRIEMQGEVKRPALFELKEGENFDQLLTYAGGFTEDAYRARVTVLKNTATERKVEDIPASQFSLYLPQSGDKFQIGRILERFTNRVQIKGAVFRPGTYELSQGLTLGMLIKKADGVKEDAFLKRGYITRLKDDFQKEQLSFSVADILAGTAEDIPLKREDEVNISSIFDLKEEYKVQIQGEIRKEGTYDFAEGMTVEELIMQAGGFKEGASPNRIEVSRRVRNSDVTSASAQTSEVFTIDVAADLNTSQSSFVLQPFDMIVVHASVGYETPKMVRIEGEVLYPGAYAINRKDERISDLIKRAGGFTAYSYAEGASLKRSRPEDTLQVDSATDTTLSIADSLKMAMQLQQRQQRLQRVRAFQQGVLANGVTAPSEEEISQQMQNDYVGINLPQIIKSPQGPQDLLLEDGDIINVPKQLQTVRISGEVLAPVTAVYGGTKGFKYYVSQAGGFSPRALKRRSYIVYANGSAQSTSSFLFFRSYPKVKPGAEIFIPQRPARDRMSAQAWVGLGTGIATLGAVIVSLFRN